ncbi:MAG: class II fructose-bisphosphatase [Tindallia sp. MSAO_Bac2]|nr:MAG: class II fructose-bisphosphatase [Tindallia sp. MSAO_Bac2]
MDRNLALDLVRVTETAALRAAKFMGRGDKNAADQAGVDGMRRMFDTIDIEGMVVIGEGEMDEAPMLYIGEIVGKGGENVPKVDIAVDPVEGTISVANGMPNAISVIAMAPRGCLLNAPDMYMDKLAVGPKAAPYVHLEAPVADNLKATAGALGKSIQDLTVAILNRDRHAGIIEECRKAGARIQLFENGDVDAALATCFEETGVDMLLGIGGAPEGVIAAAAIKCMGGNFQGQLVPFEEEEEERCKKMGIDVTKILSLDDLVKGPEAYFAATGISDGALLKGVNFTGNGMGKTHSVVMRSESGTIRFVDAIHNFNKKPLYAF